MKLKFSIYMFFFTLLSHTSTPVSGFRFIDVDQAAILVPVAFFFYILNKKLSGHAYSLVKIEKCLNYRISHSVGKMFIVLTWNWTFSEPSGPPQGYRARPRSSTSIEVFWNPPSRKLQNGVITGFNIMYTPVRDETPSVLSVDGTRRSAMLTGLRKFTKYTIWVSSKTAVGEGPPSNKFELFTDEDGKHLSYFILDCVHTMPAHLENGEKCDGSKIWASVHTIPAHFENGIVWTLAQILLPSHFSPFSKCAGIVWTQSNTTSPRI